MNIEAENFKLVMSQSDLWSTAFDIKQALESTVKSHWVMHQDVWEQNEKERLNRIKVFFYALGRPDLYDDVFINVKKLFNEHNKKNTK